MSRFSELTKKFQAAGLSFIILREPWESLEIDLLIPQDQMPLFEKEMRDLYKCRLEFAGTTPGHRIFSAIHGGEIIYFDFHLNHLSYDGITYFETEDLTKELHDASRFTLSEQLAIPGLILHSVYDKGFFKLEYLEHIKQSKLFVNNRESLKKSLDDWLPPKSSKHILSLIDLGQTTNFKMSLIRWIGLLSLSVQKMQLFHLPLNKFYKLKHLFINIRRKRQVISIIGTDGAGKSTINDALMERLDMLGVANKKYYFGWKNHEFPPVKLAVAFASKVSPAPSDSMRTPKIHSTIKDRGVLVFIREAIYLAIYYSELFYRYILHLSFRRFRPRISITDRYFYDIATLKMTYMRQSAIHLAPRPDLLIYLHSDAETIAARKDDESIESILGQQKIYKEGLSKVSCETLDIDTDQDLDRCVDMIVSRLLGYEVG